MTVLSKVGSVETYDGSSVTSATINKPAGAVENDLAHCLIRYTGTPSSTPTDWIEIASIDTVHLWQKVLGASEPSDYTWSGFTTGKCKGSIIVHSGDYDTADPVDDFSEDDFPTSDTVLKAGSITATAAGRTLLFFGNVSSASAVTCTAPTSLGTWAEDYDSGSTTSDLWHSIYRIEWTGSGATGDITATMSTSTQYKEAFLVAINTPPIVTVDPLLLGGGF